jgi:GntR family transcriptional regulator
MTDLRRDQPVPLYYQVEIALRRAIEAGQFPDGRLPTEDDLHERFAVSRITVRSALRRLEEDGLIERHRARGTFVRADATAKIVRAPGHLLGFESDLRRQGVSPAIQVLAFEVVEPPPGVSRDLGVEPGASAHRLRRLGRADGEPLWLESRYFTDEVGRRMADQDLSAASLTALLQDVLGVRVGSTHLHLEAASANTRQARHLGVRRGHPLLVNQSTFFDTGGRPLEVLRAAFRGDRYAFSFDLPARPSDPSAAEDPAAHWPALIAQAAMPYDCTQHDRHHEETR